MLIGWVWGIGLWWGADSLVVSVSQALQRAIEQAPDLQAAATDIEAAAVDRERARALRWIPEINLRGFLTLTPAAQGDYRDPDLGWDWSRPGPFTQWVVEGVQPIYLWNRTKILQEAASALQEAAEQNWLRQREEVAWRVAQLYYGTLYVQALDELRQEAEGLLRRALRLLDSLLAEGAEGVRQADLYKARLFEEQLRLQALELERQHRVLQEGWRLQLGLSSSVQIRPLDSALQRIPLPIRPLEEYQALALAYRPELFGLRAAMEAAEATYRVTRLDRLPQVLLGVRAELSLAPHVSRFRNPFVYDPMNARYIGAGIVIRQNLNFRLTALALDRARLRREQVRAQYEALKRAVEAEVAQAWSEFRAKDSASVALERALRVANEWLRTEEINFDLDLGSAKDLVEAVQARLELRRNLYTVLYERYLAWLRLQRASGRLYEALMHQKRGES
nr:MAG: transporter [Bacteroidota bacterium]